MSNTNNSFLNSNKLTWTELKALATLKGMGFQYVEHDGYFYYVFFQEGCIIYYVDIFKTGAELPFGLDPVQNAADLLDFETNYKAGANLAEIAMVSARQGIPNTVANGWPVKITDGTSTVAVKPASTAPLSSDQALVVVLSPNQPSIPVTSAPTNSTPGLTLGDITTAVIARVVVRRTTYTEQTSNAQRSIVSANVNDSSAGTGARTVKITYLDFTGAGPYTETITMNGTTAVNTVATNICFIENIEVETAGSTGSNVGIISLKAATGGGGVTIWTIAATDNRTFGCHHYVPTGKTAHIGSQWAGHNGTVVGSGATFTINRKDLSVANSVEKQISDSFRLYGQSNSVQRDYDTPIKAVGPCRLQTYVTPETSSSTNYRASFDWYED